METTDAWRELDWLENMIKSFSNVWTNMILLISGSWKETKWIQGMNGEIVTKLDSDVFKI